MNETGVQTTGFGGIASADPDQLRTEAQTVAAAAEVTRQELDARRVALEADLQQQRDELEKRARLEMEAINLDLAPLHEKLAKAGDVIQALDLYLINDAEVQVVRDGTPAPAVTPLHLFQRVVAADEEALFCLEPKNPWESFSALIKALADDWETVLRVLPTERCVVAMRLSYQESTSRDPFTAAAVNKTNAETTWLFRNGGTVAWVSTPHIEAGKRITPRTDEFASYFENRFGDMTPGTDDWAAAEKAASSSERHYLKMFLFIQGIIDRTFIFRPLPDSGVNIMSMAAQEAGKIVIVGDEENATALPDGRPTYAEWVSDMRTQLRPGLRVLANFNSPEWIYLRREDLKGHRRIRPNHAQIDQTLQPLRLRRSTDGGLAVLVKRTDPVYNYDFEPQAAARRVSVDLEWSDRFVLPYDLMDETEIRWYLSTREARSTDLRGAVPILKEALRMKADEYTAETEFRSLIVNQIIKEGEKGDAETIAARTIREYKLGLTEYRPFTGTAEEEAKAFKGVMTLYRMHSQAAADPFRDTAVKIAQNAGAIAVARDKQGVWSMFTPTADELMDRVFLDQTRIYKNGTSGDPETGVVLTYRKAAGLHVAWSSPLWDTWTVSPGKDVATRATIEMHLAKLVEDTTGVLRIDGQTARGDMTGLPVFRFAVFTPSKYGQLYDQKRWELIDGQLYIHSGGYRDIDNVVLWEDKDAVAANEKAVAAINAQDNAEQKMYMQQSRLFDAVLNAVRPIIEAGETRALAETARLKFGDDTDMVIDGYVDATRDASVVDRLANLAAREIDGSKVRAGVATLDCLAKVEWAADLLFDLGDIWEQAELSVAEERSNQDRSSALTLR